jgi:hypothetical protein
MPIDDLGCCMAREERFEHQPADSSPKRSISGDGGCHANHLFATHQAAGLSSRLLAALSLRHASHVSFCAVSLPQHTQTLLWNPLESSNITNCAASHLHLHSISPDAFRCIQMPSDAFKCIQIPSSRTSFSHEHSAQALFRECLTHFSLLPQSPHRIIGGAHFSL